MLAWLSRIDQHFPLRYATWLATALLSFAFAICWIVFGFGIVPSLFFLFLVGVGLHDTRQQRRSVLRNYPVIGHVRFLLEYIRPEIRQYFIESENEQTPFSRQQRSLVYQRAKVDSDKRPFGTQIDVLAEGYDWINHSLFPTDIRSQDFRVRIGDNPASTQPYEASIFNISAMSFGALSANAILALNSGARKGGFAHDTGEGSISEYHRVHGGDLIWEIGSGYFGCRDDQGRFSEERFARNASEPKVRLIEIKLSQGAKPGHGGVLPGAKVTPEIAAARGVQAGEDCISPARHSEFSTPIELLQFVATIAATVRRKAYGFQALHRSSVGMVCDLQSDAADGTDSGLHCRRRQGRRYWRSSA